MMENLSPLAGKPAPASILVNVPRLVADYYSRQPDPAVPSQRVAFGTSGHRGSAFSASFNESHILAIAQAVCLYRHKAGFDGPLFLGMDTHALSEPAFISALEVLVANDVTVMIDKDRRYTPTPVISHAILTYNKNRKAGHADGIVISPSHNPPDEGGFKYNPSNGGPADVDITQWIEKTANAIIENKLADVRRVPFERALKSSLVNRHDYISAYVSDLALVIDFDVIRSSGVRIGIDPLGGAAIDYWDPVVATYKISATVTNRDVDPTFRFMTVDWDGKIRMDCSSPSAMTRLIGMRDKFDVAFANDTDADRHGIVCPSNGLMNPNYYLAAAISYLFENRPDWKPSLAVGKTAVSSGMIDRVATKLPRKFIETPVGFKWFSQGLIDGSLGFAGEESAGASFLRRDGSVWTTDKDGLIMGLLAAEITARTGTDPNKVYENTTRDQGQSWYQRIDQPADAGQRACLGKADAAALDVKEIGGEPVKSKLSRALGNNAPLGGIKVVAENGWFAARPSGTEDIYKIYAESFLSEDHLAKIQDDAKQVVATIFAKGSASDTNQLGRG